MFFPWLQATDFRVTYTRLSRFQSSRKDRFVIIRSHARLSALGQQHAAAYSCASVKPRSLRTTRPRYHLIYETIVVVSYTCNHSLRDANYSGCSYASSNSLNKQRIHDFSIHWLASREPMSQNRAYRRVHHNLAGVQPVIFIGALNFSNDVACRSYRSNEIKYTVNITSKQSARISHIYLLFEFTVLQFYRTSCLYISSVFLSNVRMYVSTGHTGG